MRNNLFYTFDRNDTTYRYEGLSAGTEYKLEIRVYDQNGGAYYTSDAIYVTTSE